MSWSVALKFPNEINSGSQLGSSATPGTDLAMEKIREWDNYVQGLKEGHGNYNNATFAAIHPQNELLCGPPGSPVYEEWSAIQELCNRCWWSRTWIIREATTPRALRIHCGTERIIVFERFRSINIIAHHLMRHPGSLMARPFDRGESNQLSDLQLGRIINWSTLTFLQAL